MTVSNGVYSPTVMKLPDIIGFVGIKVAKKIDSENMEFNEASVLAFAELINNTQVLTYDYITMEVKTCGITYLTIFLPGRSAEEIASICSELDKYGNCYSIYIRSDVICASPACGSITVNERWSTPFCSEACTRYYYNTCIPSKAKG